MQKVSQPVYLIVLGMLYILSICMGFLFIEKELSLPVLGLSTAGVLILPLAFSILDLIAEVYGYRYAKIVLLSGLVSQAFFCFITYGLAHLPSIQIDPKEFANPSSYWEIVRVLPQTFIASIIATACSLWLNVYFLSKWKVLLNGRYFFLRVFGASAIGDFIFSTIGVIVIDSGRFPFLTILHFTWMSYLAIIIITIVFLFPITALAKMLKLIEPFRVEQEKIFLNPFKNS